MIDTLRDLAGWSVTWVPPPSVTRVNVIATMQAKAVGFNWPQGWGPNGEAPPPPAKGAKKKKAAANEN